MTMIYIGIDYSITSPAICVFNSEKHTEFAYQHCEFLSIVDMKKLHGTHDNIEIRSSYYKLLENGNPIARYVHLMRTVEHWLLNFLEIRPSNARVFIEDYSFGSKGRVFHLGENCGLIKAMLYEQGFETHVVAPTQVKKFATGKGNANKEAMYDQFVEDEQIDLIGKLGLKRSGAKQLIPTPVPDIIDAYYICKYGVQND